METRVAGVHRREVVEPVPHGAGPTPVGVRHSLRLSGGAGREPDDVDVVERQRRVGIDVGEAGQPVLVVLVADDHALQAFDLVDEALDLVEVVRLDDHRPGAGGGEHVTVRFLGIAAVQRHPDEAAGGRGDEEVRRLQPVVLQHCHPVPRPQPLLQ